MIKHRNVNIPVFTIPPDWSDRFVFGEAFGELIFEAISTKEERLGTRPRALHSISFKTLTLSEQETGFIRKAIEAAGDMPMVMPLWNLKVELAADAVVGNSFVLCDDTAGSAFDMVPFCALWSDFSNCETFRTFAIGANAVQFDAPMTKQFRSGDLLVPCIVGQFKRDTNAAVTDTIGEFPVAFQERFITPGPADNFIIGGSPQNTMVPLEYELIGVEAFDQFSRIFS